MKRIAVLISAVLIILVAISACGCTSSTTPSATPSPTAKDYTQHYNDAFNTKNFTGASFSKSKSTDNNDLYTGVFANASNGTVTFAIEIMPSQTAAQTKFDQVVANKTNAGYINASALIGQGNATFFSPGTVSPMGTVQSEWTGVNVQTSQLVAIYLTQDSGADNSWTVTTMTVNTATGTSTSTSGAS
jgi:hypothetical protein